MGDYLAEQTILTMKREDAQSIVDLKNPDVALLYLALLKDNGETPLEDIARLFGWDSTRLYSAVRELVALKLVVDSVLEGGKLRAHHREYTQEEIVTIAKESKELLALLVQIEKLLGRRLTNAEKSIILELFDANSMPLDVIFLLFYHCLELSKARKEPFSMKFVEQDGLRWVTLGVNSRTAAEAQIRKDYARQDSIQRLMALLGQGDRVPTSTEEKYLNSWMDMGFTIDAVGLACDKTIMRCGEFRWAYCDGILRRWHGANMHTTAEIKSVPDPQWKPEEPLPF